MIIRIKYIQVLLLLFFMPAVTIAQGSDCKIYEQVLQYVNSKYSNVDTVYEGTVNPESNDIGKPVKLDKESIELNFYVIRRKSDFSKNHIDYWFSNLMRDTILINNKFDTGSDSLINCTFHKIVKCQFTDYESVSSFSLEDYITIEKEEGSTYYTPARVMFSNILYNTSGKQALVFAKVLVGVGSRDNVVYGFDFQKKGCKWVLEKVEYEMR